MGNIYLIIVVVLIVLAISDLIVGVSNDAVNFLNSAIGSKVAPLRTILIVAGLGILFGATFSGGMMEVARKGIFNPGSFYFSEIMIIFLAVMLTDVILLDLFNTFGLPTSTTVSLVFELLGAAVGISIVKILNNGESFAEMMNYINTAKALAIISGILVSVVVAFTIGAIVQYISRIIFSFNYQKTMLYFGALWGGVALTTITYFMIIKGAKGASFLSAENIDWMMSHTSRILGLSFIFWTIVMQLLYWAFKFNILKFVVLSGTFALAMAFAGNDLVNFIGVPLAGFESFKIFSASDGASPDGLLMSSLAGKVKTPTLYLLIAGLIMVITLWLSKKARSVVKTSINLSDQEETEERFASSMFARTIVRQSISIGKVFRLLIPDKIMKTIDRRFDAKPFKKYVKQNPGVSFDLIRASVILVVSSILIASATSLRLPLSTTYVTFMVAMGTSLADGAWGRESAVYRITGVVAVISGWFFTALSAFTVALLVAIFIHWTGIIGILIMVTIAVLLVIKTHSIHSRKTKKESKEQEKLKVSSLDHESIFETCSNNVISLLIATSKSYCRTVNALNAEKRKKLKEDFRTIKSLNKEVKSFKKEVPKTLQKLNDEAIESGHHYIEVVDYLRELMHALSHIVIPSFEHVNNNHTPLNKFQGESLMGLCKDIKSYIDQVIDSISKSKFSNSSKLISQSTEIVEKITKIRKKQLKIIKNEPGSTRTNMLFLDILNESKNCVLFINNIYKSFRDFSSFKQSKTFNF